MTDKPTIYGKDAPLSAYQVKESFENGRFVYRWRVFTYLDGKETEIASSKEPVFSYRCASDEAREIACATDARLRAQERGA